MDCECNEEARYEIRDTKTEVEIVDTVNGYSVTINPNWRDLGIDQGMIYIDQPLIKSGVIVTGRDFSQYPREVKKLPLNKKKQYVEIGAGLGGFIPHLLTKFNRELEKKPIVIDIVEYDTVKRLFERGIEEAYRRHYSQRIIDRLNVLRNRADFYLNSLDIRLINMSLGQALNYFPDLVGCADVVVDNVASAEYPQIEFPKVKTTDADLERIIAMRETLLKKGKGIIVGS